jgi:O-antigen/teichoic acid export membrane protein
LSSVLQSTTAFLSAELTPDRMRVWGIRAGLSILDQGLTSGTGFLLNLFLARWLASKAYGAFAVAFATLLFLSGYHNVLLLEPMSVIGPTAYPGEMTRYLLAQLRIHAVLVTGLSMALVVIGGLIQALSMQQELASAIMASALTLPFLLLLWLVRRMCYLQQRPSAAAGASAVYFALVSLGLIFLHTQSHITPASALILIAFASVAAVIIPLRQLQVLQELPFNAVPWTRVARENWHYGRWLVGSTTLFSITTQAQTYVVAAFLGLGAAGVLRAMQVPALVMVQIVTAVSLLVLPSMSYEFGGGRIRQLKRKALLSTMFLTVIATAYAVLLAVFAKSIERAFYGGKFASQAWLIPVLALVPVFTGFALGFSMALRAAKKPHLDLLANALSAPVGLISAVVLIRFWGVGGAAFSMVAGFSVYSLVYFCSFREWVTRADILDSQEATAADASYEQPSRSLQTRLTRSRLRE